MKSLSITIISKIIAKRGREGPRRRRRWDHWRRWDWWSRWSRWRRWCGAASSSSSWITSLVELWEHRGRASCVFRYGAVLLCSLRPAQQTPLTFYTSFKFKSSFVWMNIEHLFIFVTQQQSNWGIVFDQDWSRILACFSYFTYSNTRLKWNQCLSSLVNPRL